MMIDKKLTQEKVARIENCLQNGYLLPSDQRYQDIADLLASHAAIVAETKARGWQTIDQFDGKLHAVPFTTVMISGGTYQWDGMGECSFYGYTCAASWDKKSGFEWAGHNRKHKPTHFMLITPPTEDQGG